MGLLDRYRQFSALSEEEVSRGFRDKAAVRRADELARIDPVDCSRTTWHERPPADVVGAVTFAARRGLHRYAEGREDELQGELALRLRRPAETVVVGDGAAGILEHAVGALLGPGDELLTPWPSYPLAPLLARDAGARVVPVEGALDPERLLAAVTPRTRLLVLTNPNDPTGELLRADAVEALLRELPEEVVVLVDEALRDFVDADLEARDALLPLLDEHPRLLVVRTFSKAWGLAARLEEGGVLAQPGEPLGAGGFVRLTVRDRATSVRVLRATVG